MSRRLQMYGLSHCSTCAKAREDLAQAGWTVDFRDVRDEPLAPGELDELLGRFGERLVNRASLTWRAMSDEERAGTPAAMIAAKPALMKRPAIVTGEHALLGWTANVKRALDVPA